MMITNQYQIQPNFQGNLLKEGIRLPQKKFNEVAKIYAEKTKGMPDLHLYGMKHEMDGEMYNTTYAIHSKENLEKSGCRALIPTKALKEMFTEYSPQKMAKELVYITRQFAAINKIEKLDKELDVLYAKMNNIKSQLKASTDFKEKIELESLLEKTERNIDYVEEKLKDVKYCYAHEKNEFSYGWDIIEK